LNKLLRILAQNLNTLYENLSTSQYELGIKCPHAEGLRNCGSNSMDTYKSVIQVLTKIKHPYSWNVVIILVGAIYATLFQTLL